MESAYGVLGLPDGAAPDAVRQAYKRVVLGAHPDRVRRATVSAAAQSGALTRGAAQGGSCEQFDRVQAAYATLSGASRSHAARPARGAARDAQRR